MFLCTTRTTNNTMFRMGKFAGAYTFATVRRNIAINRALSNLEKTDNKQTHYAFLVRTIKERITSTIDNDDDGFLKTDIKILKNIEKKKVFMGIKTMLATFIMTDKKARFDILTMQTMLVPLLADIDKVILRAKRVHLTYRAMRVYSAKKQMKK